MSKSSSVGENHGGKLRSHSPQEALASSAPGHIPSSASKNAMRSSVERESGQRGSAPKPQQ
ncbi:unnamed protein product, partial [Amoebophrya sp. A25]|eukprot:GSA25T00019571001.1